MSDSITINSSKARENFFDILEAVYLKNKSYIIKKSGIPVAKITRVEKSSSDKRNNIMKLAGAWKDIDTDSMIKYIYEGRRDKGEIKRRLPGIK